MTNESTIEAAEKIGQSMRQLEQRLQAAAKHFTERMQASSDDLNKAFAVVAARLRETDPMFAYQLAGYPYGKNMKGFKRWLKSNERRAI